MNSLMLKEKSSIAYDFFNEYNLDFSSIPISRYSFLVAKMNLTLLVNNSISPTIEFWFISLDIFSIVCNILMIGLRIFFLLVIILDKTCHTVPMILVGNSCLAGHTINLPICYCDSSNTFILEICPSTNLTY
jgi:hypothetical protein